MDEKHNVSNHWFLLLLFPNHRYSQQPIPSINYSNYLASIKAVTQLFPVVIGSTETPDSRHFGVGRGTFPKDYRFQTSQYYDILSFIINHKNSSSYLTLILCLEYRLTQILPMLPSFLMFNILPLLLYVLYNLKSSSFPVCRPVVI